MILDEQFLNVPVNLRREPEPMGAVGRLILKSAPKDGEMLYDTARC